MRLKLWAIAALMLAQTACLEGFETLFTTVRYDATTQVFEVERVLVNVDDSFFQCTDNATCADALERALRRDPGSAVGGSLADRLLRRLIDGGAVGLEISLRPHDGQLDVVLNYQAPAGSQAARETMVQAEWGGKPGRESYYLVVEAQPSMTPPKRYQTRKAAVGEGDWREYWVLPRSWDEVTTELRVSPAGGSIFDTAPQLLSALKSRGWLDGVAVADGPSEDAVSTELSPARESAPERESKPAGESAPERESKPAGESAPERESKPAGESAPDASQFARESQPDPESAPDGESKPDREPVADREPVPESVSSVPPVSPRESVLVDEDVAAKEAALAGQRRHQEAASLREAEALEQQARAEADRAQLDDARVREQQAKEAAEKTSVEETPVVAEEPETPAETVAEIPAAKPAEPPAIWPRPASDSQARVYAFDPQITGGISALQALSASGHLLPRVEWCYQDSAGADPTLAGTVFLSALVRADGFVMSTSVSGDLRDAGLTACLNRAVQDWNFDAWGSGDSIADVILPFTLRVEQEAQRKRKRR